MSTPSESPRPASAPGWQRWIAAVLVLAVIAVGAMWWLRANRLSAERERAAKSELDKLGALTTMDSDRKHIHSVNLSTLQSPDSLDRALSLLADVSHLKSLHVNGTAFRDEHAAKVGQLTSLQDLSLIDTQITDAALDAMQGLSGLDTIYLTNTAITNAAMPRLARLRSLKILGISGTKVTGNFESLRELSELLHLLVEQLTLDAAAIRAIGELPALTRLTIRGSTYPEDALNQLIQKRPDLAIDR